MFASRSMLVLIILSVLFMRAGPIEIYPQATTSNPSNNTDNNMDIPGGATSRVPVKHNDTGGGGDDNGNQSGDTDMNRNKRRRAEAMKKGADGDGDGDDLPDTDEV